MYCNNLIISKEIKSLLSFLLVGTFKNRIIFYSLQLKFEIYYFWQCSNLDVFFLLISGYYRGILSLLICTCITIINEKIHITGNCNSWIKFFIYWIKFFIYWYMYIYACCKFTHSLETWCNKWVEYQLQLIRNTVMNVETVHFQTCF